MSEQEQLFDSPEFQGRLLDNVQALKELGLTWAQIIELIGLLKKLLEIFKPSPSP